MRTRSIALSAAVLSAVLPAASLLAAAPTQQPPSAQPSVAAQLPALPAGVQAKLVRLQADLTTAQDKHNTAAQAKALNALGKFDRTVSDYSNALDSYNQALSEARAANDKPQEVAALNGIGRCYRFQGWNDKALATFQQALDIATASADVRGQAEALSGLGSVGEQTAQNDQALQSFARALALARQAGDHDLQGTILEETGEVHDTLGEPRKTLLFENQALALFRQVRDRDGEAAALLDVGVSRQGLGEPQKALASYSSALPLFRAVGDRDGEAQTLMRLASAHLSSDEPRKPIELDNQALAIFRAVGDRGGEAQALFVLALAWQVLGEPKTALDCGQQAVPLFHAVGNRLGEAQALDGIGVLDYTLGQFRKALDYYNQALPVFRDAGDRAGEASALNNIGASWYSLKDYPRALDFFNQALSAFRATEDRVNEASTVSNIGAIYAALRQPQQALEYYGQAVDLDRATGDRVGEATTLNNIGDLYRDLGIRVRALPYYSQALPVAAAAGDRLLEADILHNLLDNRSLQQPALAIFYGKQAVNLLQQVRSNIQGLDKDTQKTFLASNETYYRDLASLLIAQGRLPEAQQVLDLLKQQEFNDYVRGNQTTVLSRLTLTPAEQAAAADYQKSTAHLVTETERWTVLKKNKARTPAEEKEFQQLSGDLDNADKALDAYYSRLYKLFGEGAAANQQKADVKGNVSVLNHLIEHTPHVVALYTTVTAQRYLVIVITGSSIVGREFPIGAEDLNRKVAALQQALRDPSRDPRPFAQDLYKILVGPVQADLDQAQAQTLIWSLDGVLRYIPMAALYDGQHYLVEKYNNVTFTPASVPWLAQPPDMQHVSALAMGLSDRYEDDLKPLPAVVGELDDVVKDPQVPGADGVLPGSILLNGAFTEKAMEDQLDGRHAIIHIASHFVFRPGDDNASYLLLAGKDAAGSGYHLTVADFNANRNLDLEGADLLTLSACDTGMGGSARNGEEIDGLGEVAQTKGAKAVISSLWEVNDASTGRLMADFYKRWADGGGRVMKAEALREAQLDLLQGKEAPQSGDAARGVSLVGGAPGKVPPHASYTHPYYWAPFVLTGNWQ